MQRNIAYYAKKAMPPVFYPLYVSYKYRKVMGEPCNLHKPSTFSEKTQWAKLHRRNPLLTQLSDKIAVRKWVASKIGEEYMIPTVGGIYSDVEDMDFSSLPNRYVIKLNTGSGRNIIVNDSSKLNVDEAKSNLKIWMKRNYAFNSLELQYKDIKPRIYIEKNMLEEGMDDLPDYKFFCFSGKVFCSYTMLDYVHDHSKGKLGFFDRDYNLMPYYRADFFPIKEQLEKPKNYEKMVEIAEILSQGFSHVRVDLYNVDGKIYFGEMTFTTGSGYIKFVPEEFDRILGDQWDLNSGI